MGDCDENIKQVLETHDIRKDVDELRREVSELRDEVHDLVQAWKTAAGLVSFIKWLAGLGTALGVLYVMIGQIKFK